MADKKQYLDYNGLETVLKAEHKYIKELVQYSPADALVEATDLTAEHGGLKDKTAADLKGMTMSQLMDEILFPTVQPKVESQPSLTFKYDNSTAERIVEEGATLPTVSDSKFTTSVSRGSVSLKNADGNNFYAGAVDGDITIEVNSDDTTAVAGTTYTYTASATFTAGATLKDNKGNDATVAAYAGGTKTLTIKITGTKAFYANSSSIDTVAKLPLKKLVDSGTDIEVTYPSETKGEGSYKYTFDIPTGYSISSWAIYDADAKKYVNQASSWISTGTQSHNDAGGNAQEYERYVRTTDPNMVLGANQIKFTVKKG